MIGERLVIRKYHSLYFVIIGGFALLILLYLIIRFSAVFEDEVVLIEYTIIQITLNSGIAVEIGALFLIRGLNKQKKAQNVIVKYYYTMFICFIFTSMTFMLDLPLLFAGLIPGSIYYRLFANLQRGFQWISWLALVYSVDVLEVFGFQRILKIPKGLLTVYAAILVPISFLNIEIFSLFFIPFIIFALIPTIGYFFFSLRNDGEIRVESLFFALGTLLITVFTTARIQTIPYLIPWLIGWFETFLQIPYTFVNYSFLTAGLILIGAFASSIDFGMEIQWQDNIESILIISWKERQHVFSYRFSTKPSEITKVKFLAEGLHGISDLIQEITEQTEKVKIIQKEDLNIMIEYGEKFTVAILANIILRAYQFRMELFLRDLERSTGNLEVSKENCPLITHYASMLIDRHFKPELGKKRRSGGTGT